MAKKPMNKSQAIREYLGQHPKADTQEVIRALARKKTAVDPRLVASVRFRSKSKAKPSGRSKLEANETSVRKRGKPRPFPPHTLEEALQVPKVIREMNNGKPWDTDQVAKALGYTKASTRFFYLAAASRDYGLTVGSRDTEQIELSDLGNEIFFARDADTGRQKKIDAFLGVDLFKKVYDHYAGSASLPAQEYFGNVLQREFGLAPEFHQDFANIFKANCVYLGIEAGLSPLASDKARKQEDVNPDVRVVGEAKGKFDRTAFVIMPFSEKGETPRPPGFFKEVLTSVITPAGNKAGFAVETAQQKGSDVIHTTIINRLQEADLVIADLTDHNPNVLFELGIRLASEQPVALIRAKGTERIFDVDILRIADYDPNLWSTTVKGDVDRIADHIKATWDKQGTMRPYMEILTGKTHSGA